MKLKHHNGGQSRDADPISTGHELYREIRSRGLHLRRGVGRDDALYAELCQRLGCPTSQNLSSFLRQSGLSAEALLKAFLKVAEPFAEMFQDIWSYLAMSSAPRATEAIRIRFGFDKDGLTIDLDEFREWAATAKRVISRVLIRQWSRQSFSSLFEMQRLLLGHQYLLPTREWPNYFPGRPCCLLPLPEPAHELDRVVADIHALFQWVIDEAAADAGCDARNSPELRQDGEDNQATEHRDVIELAFLLHDLLPGWKAAFDRVQSIPSSQKEQALSFFRREIEPQLDHVERSRIADVLEPLDILNLPFWRYRWHTFEIWATVVVLRLLEDYSPVPRILDGHIALGGHQPGVVADLHANGYPKACVVVQMETPFRRGLRRAIRPDLSICFDDAHRIESRAAIVEFKQRAKLTSHEVGKVGIPYRDGSPKAGGVIIVNYDDPKLTDALPSGVVLIEGMRPRATDALARLAEGLKHALLRAGLKPGLRPAMVLLDVSSSMGNAYDNPDVQGFLKRLLRRPRTTVLRFNEGLENGGDLRPGQEAHLRTRGSTDIARAVDEAFEAFGVPEVLIVVTDRGYNSPAPRLADVQHLRECMPGELGDILDCIDEVP